MDIADSRQKTFRHLNRQQLRKRFVLRTAAPMPKPLKSIPHPKQVKEPTFPPAAEIEELGTDDKFFPTTTNDFVDSGAKRDYKN